MKKQATTTSSPIGRSVMDQIKSGKVHMKPRAYYWLLSLVTISAVVLAGITMTYLSSIVFFWLRVVTADTMAYGARANLNDAITSFPWWALVAAAVMLYVAVSLVRKQGRMYKHKTSSIVAVIVAGAIVLGFVLSLLNIGNSHTPNTFNKPTPGQGWQRNR